jgi:4a-hydroxytetrahydrobiopterin dehydratase
MLKKESCIPCQGGIPPLDKNEIEKHKEYISAAWIVVDNIKLTKTHTFNKYIDAIEFANSVAHLSEEQGHHPYIHINFREVEVILFTHKINGLHENDFLMANKIDHIYNK